ncbi:MAG: phosphoketolase family protein [Candidatus Latescibacteria bacterium]|nr:phosphoketolase family protein [Candidatus Latescibacterota bacterium]
MNQRPRATAIADERKTGLDPDTLATIERYRRAVNYLAAAQVYLKANPLLEQPLRPEHIKDRLLGHWGTAPGINLMYAHLNRLILQTDAGVLLITGPGHGAAANLANMYLEGSLTHYYPALTHDRAGLLRFIQWFSWPNGFPSHLNPALPGVIHEGGELGYALATAFGAALDNPDLIVACIVGDGEAETGPTATAWHSTKFLNPATDGAVLPILHLNSFKISSPTIFGTMTNDELEALFTGYGYGVHIVEQTDRVDEDMAAALSQSYDDIRRLQRAARSGQTPGRPRWPMIVLRSLKGWTGPQEIDGKVIEGSFRAHQVPGKDLKTNPAHLQAVERWLRSYRPQELFDEQGRPAEDILTLCPHGDRRMAMNPHSVGGKVRQPLDLPPLDEHAVAITGRGATRLSGMERLGGYLRDVIQRNQHTRNFRIVCPDELESNRLGAVFEVTNRQYAWPIPEVAEHLGPDGRVLEVLSEHNCQGWLQGYLLTGRHGLFPCYEAFISIVDGMMNQYAKFLKSSLEIRWRLPISSLNYLLTSESWRQDHNGYSHQGPGFINNLMTKKGQTYRIYLPPDANCLVSTIDHCLRTTNYINLVIAGKLPMPQWLSMAEAVDHCRVGASVWRWASTHDGEAPEIILAGCGDNLTLEVMAAAQILREDVPDWRVRVVNVTDLMVLGIPQKYPHGLDEGRFQRLFPLDCPVIVNFHGYTAAIKQLIFERPQDERFDINGYREEGTTTTPFDMQVRNRTSRYHVVIQAAQKMAARNPAVAARAEEVVRTYERKLSEHRRFIDTNGIDPPEIAEWRW